MKQSRKGAMLIGYVTVALNAVSSIILTNLYVRYLGYDTYGLYQMINAITQYILLFDFGITSTVMRFRITVLEKGEQVEDENLLAHCGGIIIVLIALVLVVGTIISVNIDVIYTSLTLDEVLIARKMLFFIIGQIVMTLVQHFLLGIIMSEEHYSVTKITECLKVLLKLIFVALLVVTTKNVMVIIYADFIVTVICLIAVLNYTFKNIKFRIWFHYLDVKLLRTIFFLMFALMLQSIATYVNSAAGKTIIGMIMDKSAVAVYAFAVTINSFFAAIPNSMNSIYVPKATQLVLQNASGEDLTDLVIKPGRIQFMFCGAVVTGFVLFGRYFLHIWAGSEAEGAWICAVLLIVTHLFPLVQNVCLSILTAMNKRLVRSLIVVGTSVLNIVMTVILVERIGIVGAAIGTAISVVIGNVIACNIYYHKYIGLNVFRMYKEIFRKTISCILIASVCSAFTLKLSCGEWQHLILGCGIYVLIYAIMLWVYGMNVDEKQIITNIYSKIMKRRK